jgi:hypothetical protein
MDTCCIDKSSSAELTEAINSMFRWYKESTICFAYLSDLPAVSPWLDDVGEFLLVGEVALGEYLPRCRWFTRGWTLQELIASKNVEFYDEEWYIRGDKVSLRRQIWLVTGIEEPVLDNSDRISTVPVARRMSWAAKRQTTRVEDLSYCLFGIFDVHLPLIYGEGMKAFLRLQEAIGLENNDLSLFSWRSKLGEDPGLRGIFALHPSEFESCGKLQRAANSTNPSPVFWFTNKGFHITTRLRKSDGEYLMDLQCSHGRARGGPSRDRIFIRLLKTADGFVRHESNKVDNPTDSGLTPEVSVYIPRKVTPAESQKLKLERSRTFKAMFENNSDLLLNCNFIGRPDHLWDQSTNCFITGGHGTFRAVLDITIEGTAEFKAAGLAPAELWWEGLVLLGLEFEFSNEARLISWAVIHDKKEEVINNIIQREKESGTAYALEHIREPLSRKFPVDLEFQVKWEGLLWELKDSKKAEILQWLRWVEENHFRLHMSTKSTEEDDDKHVLVLAIRRESGDEKLTRLMDR